MSALERLYCSAKWVLEVAGKRVMKLQLTLDNSVEHLTNSNLFSLQVIQFLLILPSITRDLPISRERFQFPLEVRVISGVNYSEVANFETTDV